MNMSYWMFNDKVIGVGSYTAVILAFMVADYIALESMPGVAVHILGL